MKVRFQEQFKRSQNHTQPTKPMQSPTTLSFLFSGMHYNLTFIELSWDNRVFPNDGKNSMKLSNRSRCTTITADVLTEISLSYAYWWNIVEICPYDHSSSLRNPGFHFSIFVKICIFSPISRESRQIYPESLYTWWIHCNWRYRAKYWSATRKDSCSMLDFKFWKNFENMWKLSISLIDSQMIAVIVDVESCIIIIVTLWLQESPYNDDVWLWNLDFYEKSPCRPKHGNLQMKGCPCDPGANYRLIMRIITISHTSLWNYPWFRLSWL